MLSDNTTKVSVTARWTQTINDVPRVVVYRKSSNAEWITLGAERKRWTTVLGVRSWTASHADKYAVYEDFKDRISDIAKSYSASGYLFCWISSSRPLDEIGQVPVIYSVDSDVTMWYDETVSYSA